MPPLALVACCLAWLLSTHSMEVWRSPPRPVRTLLIDNYDSYTYNIFQILAEINGAEPRVIYNDAFSSWEACLQQIPANTYDNVVISPGPGHPSVAADFGLCRDCILLSDKPVLGVCLGHQGIVTAYGGAVGKAPSPMHGRLSPVLHSNEGLFEGLPQSFHAVRYHSLAAQRPLPEELQETAWTADGDGVLMGLRHRHRELHGVQFHPESIRTDYGRRIFANFRDITARAQAGGEAGGEGAGALVSPPLPSAIDSPWRGVMSHGGDAEGCWIEKIAPLALDSEQLFSGLYGAAAASFWLDSASNGSGSGASGSSTLSFMGSVGASGGLIAEYRGRNDLLLRRGSSVESRRANLFEFIRDEIGSGPLAPARLGLSVDGRLPFNISRALFGYIGYENRHEAAAITQSSGGGGFNYSSTHHPSFQASAYSPQQPPGLLLSPQEYLVYDHAERCAYAVGAGETGAAALVARVRALEASPQADLGGGEPVVSGALVSSETRQQYEQHIQRCLDLISRGETYEVCLTTQFTGERRVGGRSYPGLQRHLDAYLQLRRRNPAPLASFFHFDPRRLPGGDELSSSSGGGGEAFSILSSSPERFLSCSDSGLLTSKPIKGTAKRCLSDPREDALIALRLGSDEKALAENLMVLDLVRNDFGRVCAPGSVTVPRLMHVESYASVHQLVSTVQGRLRAGAGVADAIVATFPAGSMTGAPKVRTMDIIDSIEQRPRGIYSGSIGYIGYNGVADLNVVIRTALFRSRGDGDSVTVAGGGAVVAMSDPRAEVEEVLLKGRAVAAALGLTLDFKGDGAGDGVSSGSSSIEEVHAG